MLTKMQLQCRFSDCSNGITFDWRPLLVSRLQLWSFRQGIRMLMGCRYLLDIYMIRPAPGPKYRAIDVRELENGRDSNLLPEAVNKIQWSLGWISLRSSSGNIRGTYRGGWRLVTQPEVCCIIDEDKCIDEMRILTAIKLNVDNRVSILFWGLRCGVARPWLPCSTDESHQMAAISTSCWDLASLSCPGNTRLPGSWLINGIVLEDYIPMHWKNLPLPAALSGSSCVSNQCIHYAPRSI